jgi:hypothetical protein
MFAKWILPSIASICFFFSVMKVVSSTAPLVLCCFKLSPLLRRPRAGLCERRPERRNAELSLKSVREWKALSPRDRSKSFRRHSGDDEHSENRDEREPKSECAKQKREEGIAFQYIKRLPARVETCLNHFFAFDSSDGNRHCAFVCFPRLHDQNAIVLVLRRDRCDSSGPCGAR